jgi:hypothetical protein
MSGRQRHHEQERSSGLRSRHALLVAVATVLALGWLAWNALLVESDVAAVAVGEDAATGQGR